MPKPIEDYVSQQMAAAFYKIAMRVWFSALALVLVWSILIILPAILAANGAENLSAGIYTFFSYICHQMPHRSFHIFEQQFAVCSRCFGVYFGLFTGLLIYPLLRRVDNIEPFPRIWLILACVPLAIDFSLTFFSIWENTFITRFITGLILGVACSVYILPAIIEITSNLYFKRNTASANQ